MLKTRILTGLLLVIVFFMALFLLPTWGFALFITAIVMAGVWEWSNLAGLNTQFQRMIYSLITGLLMLAALAYVGGFRAGLNDSAMLNILLASGAWWALALLWVQGYPSSAVIWGSRWARVVIGWFVLIPGWLALVYLHQMPQGAWLIVLVAMTVFVADTGAYLFGRAFGKHKLAAEVSPGKSWEGFFGGLACCCLLVIILSWQTTFGYWPIMLSIVVPTALASVLGDLLESMCKRHRGVKDSGFLLPGHGGVMDRLDSLSAATPVFVLGVLLSGWDFT